MESRSLTAWLTYLAQQHPKKISLGLERVKSVAAKLALNDLGTSTVITVAGTNGKGFCVALLSAIYRAADHTVGTFTSPHLFRYNERIQYNNALIDDERLCELFAEIDNARGDIPLTYFEFSTLAALAYFKQEKPDIILLEIGLGGRLDAVNSIDPTLSIITSISIDHTEWLGATREEIAYEKAGVMRQGVPTVCGETDIPQSIYRAAEESGAELLCYKKDYTVTVHPDSWSFKGSDTQYAHLPLPQLRLQNAATAVRAVSALQALRPVPEKALAYGLKTAKLLGRFTRVPGFKHADCLYDVAHNPASCLALAEQLAATPVTGRRVAVFSMLMGKDIAQCLSPLREAFSAWYIAPLRSERALPLETIAAALRSHGITCYSQYSDSEQAFLAAQEETSSSDQIVLFGSFHTISDALGKNIAF